MNLLYILPELKCIICELSSCQTIIKFALCSKSSYKIVKDNNLFNKRKYLGFPRSDHCKSYDISKYKDNYNNITIEEANILLDKLNNHDLVRGDLLYVPYNDMYNTYYIFDGHKIINLECVPDYTADFQIIFSEFLIGVDNIDIDYYRNVCDENDYIIVHALEHSCFWLEITENIRNQLIKNVEIIQTNSCRTNFTVNNIKYFIVDANTIYGFERILSTKFKILVDRYSIPRYYGDNMNRNVLKIIHI